MTKPDTIAANDAATEDLIEQTRARFLSDEARWKFDRIEADWRSGKSRRECGGMRLTKADALVRLFNEGGKPWELEDIEFVESHVGCFTDAQRKHFEDLRAGWESGSLRVRGRWVLKKAAARLLRDLRRAVGG